ncbi:MAG: YegS/Rv2252/BmrU family lipid kinase [bacterium]|nr:YegS/Rv2252/BmrU family lipid kinase [bacterium]
MREPSSPRVLVVGNPGSRGGAGLERLRRIQSELADLGAVVRVPASPEDLVGIVREAVASGIETVVAVGGDGTVNAVVNQLAHTRVRLGVVPAGTANDLARHMGIPADVKGACARIRAGRARRLDLLDINGRLYVTAGGLGVVTETAIGVNRIKAPGAWSRPLVRPLGSLVYVLYSLRLLLGRALPVHDVEVSIDDEPRGRFPSTAVFVHNQPTIARRVQACPDARNDDGLLGVCLVTRSGRLRSLFTALRMTLDGSHVNSRSVRIWSGQRVDIQSPTVKTFIGDGEVLAHSGHLRIQVVPSALEIIA